MLLWYEYLYVHLYKVTARIKKSDARYFALLYLSAISLFLVLPLFIILVSMLGEIPKFLFLLLALAFAYLVYWANEKCIYNKKVFKKALVLFNKENRFQRAAGYTVSIGFLICSPVLFMYLLHWLY
jgi:flagellar biosynthesis component FlhA